MYLLCLSIQLLQQVLIHTLLTLIVRPRLQLTQVKLKPPYIQGTEGKYSYNSERVVLQE